MIGGIQRKGGLVSASSVFMLGTFTVSYATGAPLFLGTIQDIELNKDSDAQDYDLSSYFANATSYSISPAIPANWTFNTSTGVLTVDPTTLGDYGPFTATGINAAGSDSSNAFAVRVVSVGGGSSDPKRKYPSIDEVERLRKAYAARRPPAETPETQETQETPETPVEDALSPEINIKALERPTLTLKKRPVRRSELISKGAVSDAVIPVEFATAPQTAPAAEPNQILQLLREQDEMLLLLLVG